MYKLNDDNYLILAMKNYDNGVCKTVEEFNEDLNRIKYIKRLLTTESPNSVKLALNHIIIMHNVFGNFATEMLYYKIDRQYWKIITTILIYLNKIDNRLPDGTLVSDIGLDESVIKELRQI